MGVKQPTLRRVTAMKARLACLAVVALAATGTVVFVVWYLAEGEPPPPPPVGQPIPVASNRGADVPDGFRGDIHPLLFGQKRLDVTAEWTPVGTGRDQLHRDLNPALYRWFTELRPAHPRQAYTQREFSGFLPETVGEVGQRWALDDDRVVSILKQFHPRPSLHVVAAGRRAGPDGAFAVLRAVSPTHLDIVFRIHAEFYLTPDDWPASQPLIRAWYTPAYFTGRVLVNRELGTVEHFRLALAADKALNVHLTVAAKGIGDTRQAHDVVRVDRMELTGGDGKHDESIAWTSALTMAEAQSRLASIFYKFLDIDWAPIDCAAALASSRNRPIFAVVSWGAFDDQSC